MFVLSLEIHATKHFEKSKQQIMLNNEFACIGQKDEYLYLINNKLESEKIYKISNYYDSEYIVRDGRLYVIYDEIGGNTKYVDVIDLTNNTQRKITMDEIENDKLNLGYNIYYHKKYMTYYKNFETKKEETDNYNYIKDNYLYYIKDKSLIRKNLNTNKEEKLYTYSDICYEFILGQDKIYHCGDKYFYCYNLKTKNNNIIGPDKNSKTGHGVTGRVVEYNNSIYAYTDEEKVYIIDDVNNTKSTIFEKSNDGKISDISLICKDILQISVSHLGSHGTNGVFWAEDEWHYYNFKTKQLMNIDNDGFENLIVFSINNINYDKTLKNDETEENKDLEEEEFDLSEIEDNSSINKNRIINDLNENINDNEIINVLKISSEDFNDYKENFLGTNSDNTFADDINKEKEYKELAKRNFIVLKNYILKSDETTTQVIYNYLNNNLKNKYNMIYARVISGMLNYYISDIKEIKIDKGRNVPAGGYEIELTVNSNYVISYSFGDEKYDNYGLIIYEGVTSFDEVYNNYDLYENDKNTYLSLILMSYDFLGYWDYLMNNY